MPTHLKELATQLIKREEENSLRSLKVNNPQLIDFSSNDYLGLAKIDLSSDKKHSKGATGSRLLTGNFSQTEQLESSIATYFGYSSGLIYSSGYMANLGLMSTFPQRGDIILYDKLVHASIRDGISLSKAKKFSFAHNDLADLEKRLKKFASPDGAIWVVVESLYSMDGDIPALKLLSALCKKYNAQLIVDEAHAVGTLGLDGKGLVSSLGLQQLVTAVVITFGKSLANHGAIVLSNKLLRDYQINFSRPFIYTTAPPPDQISYLKNSFAYFKSNAPDLTKKLKSNIDYFNNCLINKSICTDSVTTSPIKAIRIGNATVAKQISEKLNAQGIDVRPILSPTVAQHTERLRVCLHSFNTHKQINQLVTIINKNFEK